MVSLTGYVLLSFLLMGALTLDVRRKGLQVMAALFVPIASVLLQSVLLVIRCWTDPFPESLMPLLAAAWGSFAGVLLWLATGSYAVHSFRHFLQTDSRRAVIDWLATTTVVAIVIFAWLPFDLVSSLNMLSAKTDAGELTLIPFRDTTSISWSLLAGTVAAFPIGVFAGTVGTRGKRSARSVSESLPIGLLILAGVELVQVFIRSQPASTTDVLAGIPGVIAGAWWLGDSRSPLPGQVRAALHQAGYLRFLTYELMTILYVVFLCGILWGPFHFNSSQSSVNEELAGILSLPFQKLYPRGEYAPLAKVILFIPLGASLGYLVGSIAIPPGVRQLLQKIAFVLCLCLGIGIELIQAFFQPYRPSLDDVLFYAVGAFIGMALAARLAMARR